MKQRTCAIVFTLGSLLAIPALAAKIEHSKIVEPKVAMAAPPELEAVGAATRVLERGGSLYVAGVQGVAQIGADGKAIWSTPLDPIGVREIAVDDAGIAYSGYEIVAKKTSAWSFLGEMPSKLQFTPSIVGMLSPGGQKVWQANGPASRISAPCLTPVSIGVLTGQTFQIYARSDGQLTLSKIDLDPAMLPNEYAGRMFRPQPLFIDNAFVGGYFYNLYRVGPAGEILAKESKGKTNVVAGPLLFQGHMLIGSYSTTQNGDVNKSLVTVVETTDEFKKVWREDIADDHSATGDIVIDGDTIYASSNFTLSAVDAKGKEIWDVEGKEGAIAAGSMRGVRFARNFGYRYWGGHLLALSGDRLYLGTQREIAKKTWADVITVINKKDGSYVETIDVKKSIVDMTIWGDRLVLATPDGVLILAIN